MATGLGILRDFWFFVPAESDASIGIYNPDKTFTPKPQDQALVRKGRERLFDLASGGSRWCDEIRSLLKFAASGADTDF